MSAEIATSSSSEPSMAQSQASSSAEPNLSNKERRLAKLKQLHIERNSGARMNHKEVIEEKKREAIPENHERKQEWAKRKLSDLELKEKCEAEKLDYEVEVTRNIQADEADRWQRRKAVKKNPDMGFTSFEDLSARKYDRMSGQLKPDIDKYQELKEKVPKELLYPTKDTHVAGTHKDSKEAIDRLCKDMDQEYKKQSKFSRRRTFDDDADINYINERNYTFNKKVERFYGKYTKEIKQNLERGTAI